MNEYKHEYVFTKNDDGRIVAQSIDRMHHFLLPFDLDSKDVNNVIFEALLKKSIGGKENSSDSFIIDLNLFKSAIVGLDGVNDENVALAVFEYLNKIGHYSFSEYGNILLLEEMGDDILDRPMLLQKWVCFYDHLLTSTEHAAKICGEMYNRFTDKLNNLPGAIETLHQKIESNLSDYERINNKINSGATLTKEEENKKEIARTNALRYQKQKKFMEEGEKPEVLKKLEEYLGSISQFLSDKDIYIAAYTSSKAIFEAGREASESDMKYAIDLTKKVANLTPLKFINEELTEEDLSDENFQALLKQYGKNTAESSKIIDVAKNFNGSVSGSN